MKDTLWLFWSIAEILFKQILAFKIEAQNFAQPVLFPRSQILGIYTLKIEKVRHTETAYF